MKKLSKKERWEALKERMRNKRLGKPQSKEDMERMIRSNAPLIKNKAMKLHKRMEKSDIVRKSVEKGAKAVVKNLAKQEGVSVDKKDIEITKKDYEKAKEFY